MRQGKSDAGVDSLETLLGSLPSSDLAAKTLFELGMGLVALDRHREAISRFRELLLTYPAFERHVAVRRLLADTHLALGEYGEAASLLRWLAELSGSGQEGDRARRHLARAYEQSGQLSEALAVYDEIIDAASVDSLALERALLLVKLSRVSEALEQLTAIAAGGEGGLAAVAARHGADLLFEKGRFKEAYELYGALIAEGDADLVGRGVICLWRLGRDAEAENAASRFGKRFGKRSGWHVLFQIEQGRFLIRKGEFDRANKLLGDVADKTADREAVELAVSSQILEPMIEEPHATAAYWVSTCLWEANLAAPTEEGLHKALAAQTAFLTTHSDNSFVAAVQLRLGRFHLGHKRHLPAAGAFRAVLDHGSRAQKEEAIWLLLRAYLGGNLYDPAYRTALRMEREFPKHPEVNALQLEIGYILSQMGQYSRAIGHFEGVLEWAAGEAAAEARYYIGEAFQHMGEYRTAIRKFYDVSYRGADASSNWITAADFQRAQCHEVLGENDTAIGVYEKIIEQNGINSPYGKEARKRIDDLN